MTEASVEVWVKSVVDLVLGLILQLRLVRIEPRRVLLIVLDQCYVLLANRLIRLEAVWLG